MPYNRITTKR